MNIEMDEAAIMAAVKDSVGKTIAEAMSGYSVRDAIGKAITSEATNGIMAESIAKAMHEIANPAVIAVMGRAIADAMIVGTQAVVVDSVARMVTQFRGIADYDPNYKSYLASIRQDLMDAIKARK